MSDVLRELLYKKYIEPTKRRRQKYIGVEIEMPVLSLENEAVDTDAIQTVTKEFIEQFDFSVTGIDSDGNIYSAQSQENGDILSYDCSYNNLELSFGKEKNLFAIKERFDVYYTALQQLFSEYRYIVTGLGVNPNRNINNNVPIANERYRMLFHHLSSYPKYERMMMKFHSYPKYGMFSSASQVQLDVDYELLAQTVNTFSLLEPVKAMLFSNSVMLDEDHETLCSRDMFWENSTHGINPHNIGMYNCEFENADQILSYIETTSMYCVERSGKYINFPPVPLREYFSSESITGEYYDNGQYRTISFKPELSDLKYLRTFKFEDITYRGTIEYRSVCCQPISDVMTVSAFHLGAMSKTKELSELLKNDHTIYNNGYSAGELRKLLNKRTYPAFMDIDGAYTLCGQILDIIEEGLRERGLGEEIFLQPLFDRVHNRTNPARELLRRYEGGEDILSIAMDYAALSPTDSAVSMLPLHNAALY